MKKILLGAFLPTLATCGLLACRFVLADPPDFVQWQRHIEVDRINDSLTKGDFDEALALATDLVRDYKKAIARNSTRRPGRRGEPTWAESQPTLIHLCFLLAQTERIVGDYDRAKTQLKEVDNDVTALEGRLLKQLNFTQQRGAFADRQFMAAYARWVDGLEQPRGQARRAITLLNTAVMSDIAWQDAGNAQHLLFETYYFHAKMYDELGALELDAGRPRSAEAYFRKSTQYWGDTVSASGPSLTKHLRNYARLYVKDAEDDIRMFAFRDADQALDRAETYLAKARRSMTAPVQSTGFAGPGGPAPPSADEAPDGWGMTDLLYQEAEYHTARADWYARTDPAEALSHLDKAETAAIRALDSLARLVPQHHPFHASGWLELAGINARRVIYGSLVPQPSESLRSCASDMLEYWKRSEAVITESVKPKRDDPNRDNALYRIRESERVVLRCADSVAKLLPPVAIAAVNVPPIDPGEDFPLVGSKVRRGPDWESLFEGADGGEGEASVGEIVRIEDDGWLVVRWDRTGRTTTHRPGGDGRDDLVDLNGNVAKSRPRMDAMPGAP